MPRRSTIAKISVVLGDPSTEETWIHAHLHNAKLLVLLESGAESLRIAEAARRVSPNLPIVVAATSRGIWPEVTMEKVTFLSTVEASARLISAQTAAAMRADITLGNPVCKGDVEAAAAEAADRVKHRHELKPARGQARRMRWKARLLKMLPRQMRRKQPLKNQLSGVFRASPD